MPSEPAAANSSPPDAGQSRGRVVLYGLGRDGDGHIRITMGRGFCLAGGSESTHETMSAQALLLMSALREHGYSMDNLTRQQVREIVDLMRSMCPEEV